MRWRSRWSMPNVYDVHPGRGLLGGLRRRLGGRAFLHRLRAAAGGRDHRAVRGQARRHARRGRVLARDRAARRRGAVHGADRDPRDPQGGSRGGAARPTARCRRCARSSWRASAPTPTPTVGEPRARPSRHRPLVADRDGLGDRGELPGPRSAARQGRVAQPARARLPHRRARRRGERRPGRRAGRHRGAPAPAARHAPHALERRRALRPRRTSRATPAGT